MSAERVTPSDQNPTEQTLHQEDAAGLAETKLRNAEEKMIGYFQNASPIERESLGVEAETQFLFAIRDLISGSEELTGNTKELSSSLIRRKISTLHTTLLRSRIETHKTHGNVPEIDLSKNEMNGYMELIETIDDTTLNPYERELKLANSLNNVNTQVKNRKANQ
jgi:hypothetical protein